MICCRFFNNAGSTAQHYSAGSVARIRVFNRVLSPAEVAALDRLPGGACTAPTPTPTPNATPGPTPTPAPTPTPTPTPIPGGGCFATPASLANWYPGQGNSNDTRGPANGTPAGAVTFPAGKVGQAFAFDGNVNTYITLPSLPLTQPPPALGQSFSLEFWINPGRDGAFQHVISNAYDSPNFGALYMENNKLSYWNRGRVFDSLADVPLNQWTHAALVYNGTVVRLYVNGVLDRESNQQGITFNTPVRLADDMGRDTERTFQGMLDEVSFYNGPLTAADVQAIFNAGGQGKCTGTTTTPTPTPTPTTVPGTCPTFSNSTSIAIPATGTSGNALPYPSNITATGATGTVSKVVVKLNGLTHQFPDDIDMLLVGPGGQNAIIMSDADSDDPGGGITLTLDDAAANPIPDTGLLTTGTYRPTNYGSGDTFPAPAPVSAGGSALSVFNGTDPNGTWSLFIVDDGGGDTGSLTGGWELQLTTTTCGGPAPTPTPSPSPGLVREIAFQSSRDGDMEIFTMNADGSAQTQETNNSAGDFTPKFSADGNRIVFMSDRDGNPEIYVMNADGSGETRLTNDPRSDGIPSFLPDGRIVFQRFITVVPTNIDIFIMNADGTGQTALTSHPDADSAPHASPDGTRIVFSSTRDGNSEIYVMNTDGTGQTRLTNNAAIDARSQFSPDGGRIVFESTRDGNNEIYYMNADGSDPRRVTNNAANDFTPSFSPDGCRIAFASTRDGNDEVYVTGIDGLGLMPPNGCSGNRQWSVLAAKCRADRLRSRNTDSYAKSCSTPTADRIAFATDRDSNREVYVMNPDGTCQTRRTNATGIDSLPDISPDGERIVFASARDGNNEIYIMNADGSGQTNLTNNPAPDGIPSFSPDGTRIVFTSVRGGSPGIFIMNDDGTGQTRLTTSAASDVGPRFSPDGNRIVFSRFGNDFVTQEIYVVDVDGTDLMQITNDGASSTEPSFSPDGTRILFASYLNEFATGEIYAMNANGTNHVRLTNNSTGDSDPIFSPDGSRIAFTATRDGVSEIYVMNADGSGQTRVTTTSAGFFGSFQPSWGRAPASNPILTCPPPPSGITISGRVFTPTGLGLRNAIVTLIDAQNNQRRATTSSFGVYSFENVPLGTGYFLTVSSKRFRFAPRSLEVNGTMANVDFFGLE